MPDTDNTRSDADLRRILNSIWTGATGLGGDDDYAGIDEDIAEINALFQAETDRLLHEVIEQAVEVNTIQYNYDNGDKVVAGFTNSAVPVAVLNTYLRGGNHDG